MKENNVVVNAKGNEEIDYSKYVYYDESSPTCLRWKISVNKINREGTVAGYFRKNSEGKEIGVFVCINKKFYPVNKIVWQLHDKNYSCHMHHKDGNRFNTKISNLESRPKSTNVHERNVRNSHIDRRAYNLWTGIKKRLGLLNDLADPTYVNASMYIDWVDNVRKFETDIKTLPDYNSKDENDRYFEIDKDLFSFGSGRFGYYPDTVCFLPQEINISLHLGHEGNRSKNKGLPVGVTKDGNVYKAQLSVNGKPKYLGTGTIDECKELYKRAKVSRLEKLIVTWSPVLPEKVINQLHLFVNHLKAF